MKIEQFNVTICLHSGMKEVVLKQMDLLKPLENFNNLKFSYNNRYIRHPGSYDSWSELTNDAIITSPDEHVIIINDRTVPKPDEVIKIICLLNCGFAAASIFSVGFIGFSKQLFRTIGFFDERFYGGGWEDDDFILRMKLANLAYYESREGQYDFSFRSSLRPPNSEGCVKSQPFFAKKWIDTGTEFKRVVLEEDKGYKQFLGFDRKDISDKWAGWDKSSINVNETDGKGASLTRHFMKQPVNNQNFIYTRKVTSI